MRTRRKPHLIMIALVILAASAGRIGAADPDVYMNSAAPPGPTSSIVPAPAPSGATADEASCAASNADADVYLRGDPTIGGSTGSADLAWILEVIADALTSLLN